MTRPARLDNHQLIQGLDRENKQLRKELNTLKDKTAIAAVTTLTVAAAAAGIYLYKNPSALTDLATSISTNVSAGYTWVSSFIHRQP